MFTVALTIIFTICVILAGNVISKSLNIQSSFANYKSPVHVTNNKAKSADGPDINDCEAFSVFIVGVNEIETRAKHLESFLEPCVYFISAMATQDITKNLQAMLYSGVVVEESYQTMSMSDDDNRSEGQVLQDSMDLAGFSGRSLQNEFTIACSLSHRRA